MVFTCRRELWKGKCHLRLNTWLDKFGFGCLFFMQCISKDGLIQSCPMWMRNQARSNSRSKIPPVATPSHCVLIYIVVTREDLTPSKIFCIRENLSKYCTRSLKNCFLWKAENSNESHELKEKLLCSFCAIFCFLKDWSLGWNVFHEKSSANTRFWNFNWSFTHTC